MKKAGMIFSAVLSVIMAAVFMCACNEEQPNPEYEQYKTDIIGVWINEGGPEVAENGPLGKSLRFFEFTSDGFIYHHYISLNTDGTPMDFTYEGEPYHLEGNMLVNDESNTGALILIKDDTMTMTNTDGASIYKKLSLEDTTGYYVNYKDEGLYEKQSQLKEQLLSNSMINTENAAGQEMIVSGIDAETESETVSEPETESEPEIETESETEETSENAAE